MSNRATDGNRASESIESAVTGQCKCGQVTYRGQRTDVPMFRCYCRDCQQLTGTGHSEMMPLEAQSFEMRGPFREYEMTGGSGKSTWSRFCAICGLQLARRSERSPNRIYIHAASLQDPDRYQPEITIYTDAAQSWDLPKC